MACNPLHITYPFGNTQPFVNDQVIRVYAMQRSGHHAVIQWMMINGRTPSAFLNDCRPGTNPYTSANTACSLIPASDLAAAQLGAFTYKSLLICSYEDVLLDAAAPTSDCDAITAWVGSTRRLMDVIVLRDPFNLFASKYYWAIRGSRWAPTMAAIEALPSLWKGYAREFLGATSYLNSSVIRVNYNTWFRDAEYRRVLADRIDISRADEGREMVARWGPNVWGDSFDNMTYDGRATHMRVLDRWRTFKDDRVFCRLFEDEELLTLSREIFGVIPDTDLLV